MTHWIAILGVGLGSYALRVVPLLVLDRVRLSPRAEELVGHAGLAALAALVALSTRSAATGGAAPAALGAVAVAIVAARRWSSMLPVVAAGGAMYAALRLGLATVG
jgi:branched-subunit amino acid transport protein